VDGKSFKLLKRGYTTRTLAGQPSAGQIQGAVDEILRDVQIGRQEGDRMEIRGGLNAGERVVTTGAFLLDSESRMKGSPPRP